MLSRTFKIQHSRVVLDYLTFQRHQITIFTQTGQIEVISGTNGGQMEVKHHFPEHLTMKASEVFQILVEKRCKSYWRSPWYKSGGQSDLHFDNFDIRCNIVKWGVIFGVLHGS